MDIELLKKQRQEWHEFQKQHDESLNQLMADEMLIRSRAGFTDERLPDEWRDKLHRDRRAWTEEWGVTGRKATELLERHKQNQMGSSDRPTEEEMDRMYDDYKRHEERGDVTDQLQIKEYEQTEKRKRAFNELSEEVKAVQHHYDKSGKTIPAATQRRLTKQVVAFREKWDNYPHDVPSADMQTLDETDMKLELKAWNDLREQHAIIERHYGQPDDIPKATRDRMITEEKEYWQEVSTHRKQQVQQSKQSEADTAEFQMIAHKERDTQKAKAFEEQLREMRERQQSLPARPRLR